MKSKFLMIVTSSLITITAPNLVYAQDAQVEQQSEQAEQTEQQSESKQVEEVEQGEQQTEQAEKVEQTEQRPDIVETVDGSIIRGVIEVRIVGDHVSITSRAGRTYVYQWSEIVYAGPASGHDDAETTDSDTAEADKDVEKQGNDITFRVPEDAPPIRLEQEVGSGGFTVGGYAGAVEVWGDLCTTPCDVELENPRSARLKASPALGRPGARAFTIEDYVGGDVIIDYHSRQGARIGLWVTGGVLIAGGFTLTMLDILDGDDKVTGPKFIAGSSLLFTGAVFAMVGTYLKDKVNVEYELEGRDLPEGFAFPNAPTPASSSQSEFASTSDDNIGSQPLQPATMR